MLASSSTNTKDSNKTGKEIEEKRFPNRVRNALKARAGFRMFFSFLFCFLRRNWRSYFTVHDRIPRFTIVLRVFAPAQTFSRLLVFELQPGRLLFCFHSAACCFRLVLLCFLLFSSPVFTPRLVVFSFFAGVLKTCLSFEDGQNPMAQALPPPKKRENILPLFIA